MKRFFLFFLAFFYLAPAASAVSADADLPKTCNPDFYTRMDARAWMGGQRDMEAAQTLIKGGKDPGNYSVLSLICFNDQAEKVGGYVSTLVTPVTSSYVNANFSGGLCANMASIWSMTKCESFKKDDFLTLKQLVSTDLRGCNTGRDKWAAAYQLTNPAYGTPQGVDEFKTFLDLLTAKFGCASIPAVPTGVKVYQKDDPPFPDAVCPAPQCSYGGRTGICN